MRVKNPEIEAFIIENLESHSADIVALVARKFHVSRQTAHDYLKDAVKKGVVVAGNNLNGRIKIGDQCWLAAECR